MTPYEQGYYITMKTAGLMDRAQNAWNSPEMQRKQEEQKMWAQFNIDREFEPVPEPIDPDAHRVMAGWSRDQLPELTDPAERATAQFNIDREFEPVPEPIDPDAHRIMAGFGRGQMAELNAPAHLAALEQAASDRRRAALGIGALGVGALGAGAYAYANRDKPWYQR
jgi:hypothetical protein